MFYENTKAELGTFKNKLDVEDEILERISFYLSKTCKYNRIPQPCF